MMLYPHPDRHTWTPVIRRGGIVVCEICSLVNEIHSLHELHQIRIV